MCGPDLQLPSSRGVVLVANRSEDWRKGAQLEVGLGLRSRRSEQAVHGARNVAGVDETSHLQRHLR